MLINNIFGGNKMEKESALKKFQKYLAELIGTCVLVVFGCGTAAMTKCSGTSIDAAYILTALAFGLSIVAMAYSIGNVSGCHVNPAVSIGMLVSGRMSFVDFIGYIVAQFIGGIAGAAILKAFVPDPTSLGQNGLYNGSIVKSLVIEIILTFVFVICVIGVTSKPEFSKVAGIAIGLALTLVHILGISFTGTSVNPARSFGPALFVGGDAFKNVWVFIVAPLVGGILAALVYKLITAGKSAKAEN
jgi:aquaporin Z